MNTDLLRFLSVFLILMNTVFPIHADITLDGTTGNAGRLALKGPDYDIKAEYGQQAGANLFHSFSKFNINTNESANFSGPDSVQNIISRVTGSNPSWIDGELNSSIIGADLYLLNPSGVIFGKNASLNLTGSFHVSTADYLQMSEYERFYTMPLQNEVLSAAKPTAFGFLDSSAASITCEGTEIAPFFSENTRLTGKTISIIGGDIEIKNGSVEASEGQVNIIAVASPGKVTLTDSGSDISSFEKFGKLSISGESLVSVNGDTSGNIFIYSGDFFVDNSSIEAKTFGNKKGGVIDIHSDNISFSGIAKIRSENILMDDECIGSNSSESKGGDVKITASDSVSFSGYSEIRTRAYSSTDNVKAGSAGNVLVEARNISFAGGSGIRSESDTGERSGDVTIHAFESVSFSDNRSVINNSVYSSDNGPSYAGKISINAKNISFTDGGGISSHITGMGKGGNVEILASESVSFYSADGKPASTIDTTTFGKKENAGNAGDISIKADIISFQNSGGISATSEGTGNASDIILETSRLEMDSGALVSSASNSDNNAGDAGTITIGKKLEENGAIIPCDSIIMRDNSSITTQAEHAGGGKISMSAEKLLYMKDSRVTSRVKYGDRNGGDISIGNPIFTILDDSNIIARAYEGQGGNISITTDHFIQSADSEIDASSEFGVDGSIEIISPDADITNSLAMLPSDFPDASRWMKTPCSERSGEKISRFAIDERDGLPVSPDDWLASPPSAFDRSDTVMQTEKPGQLLAKGEDFYHKGDFENAARTWEQAIPFLDTKENLFVNTLEYLAYSYQKLGLYQKALSILNSLWKKAMINITIPCFSMLSGIFIFLSETWTRLNCILKKQ